MEVGWRQIPVWGFATVADSTLEDVPAVQRSFGTYPMGDELIVQPTKVRHTSFHDATAHRRDMMATVWNQYATVPRDGEARKAAARSWDVLLRPLQITGELVSDHLEAHQGTERRANALPSFEPSVPEVTRWIKSVLWRHGLLPRAHPSRPGRPSVWDHGAQEVAQRTCPVDCPDESSRSGSAPASRNIEHYPSTVEKVLAVEPSAKGFRIAQRRIDSSSVPVELVGLDGQWNSTAGCLLRRCTLHLRPVHDSRRRRRFGRGPAGAPTQEAGFHFLEHGLAPDGWRGGCGSTVWSPCSAGWQTAVI